MTTARDGRCGGVARRADGLPGRLHPALWPTGRCRRDAQVPLRFQILGPDGDAGDRVPDRARQGSAPDRGPPRPVGFPARAPRPGRRTARGACRWTCPRRGSTGCSPTSPRPVTTADSPSARISPCRGRTSRVPLPAPAGIAQVVDGYQVTLAGDLVPGQASELTLTVSKDGVPVTDLQPYLAAYGHLVALRAGDLAYLHVHPAGEPGDGVTPAGPASPSTPPRRPPVTTGCSWTSSTTGWSGPPSSPCTPGNPALQHSGHQCPHRATTVPARTGHDGHGPTDTGTEHL